MASPQDCKRYRLNWQNELDAAALYRVMADSESQATLAAIYRKLSAVEEKHARFWEDELKKAGASLTSWRPSMRTRLLGWLGGHLGPQLLLRVMATTEKNSQTEYDDQPEARGSTLPMDERSHARILSELVNSSSKRGLD